MLPERDRKRKRDRERDNSKNDRIWTAKLRDTARKSRERKTVRRARELGKKKKTDRNRKECIQGEKN